MGNVFQKILHMAPRILSILFIIFLSLFAFDVFEGPFSAIMIVGFLIHLLPSLALLLLTLAAWRFSFIGAIVFIGFALLYPMIAGFDRPWSWYALLSGPTLIIGLLYFIDWLNFRKMETSFQSKNSMNKYIGFGIVVVMIIIIAAVLLNDRSTTMSLADARDIALDSASECSQKGTVGENGVYNENSQTWWIDFNPKDEFTQLQCNPACVVDTVTKKAEINWRCTGVIPPTTYDDLLQIDIPLPNAEVTTPLVVTGKARGAWYFEASFPIKLYDANNKLIAQTAARALSDWMTEEYVPFSATMAFVADTATGTLVVQNDNPSDLPENEKEVRIPVTFINAFSSEGNVTRNNPGQKPDIWYLVYERPGSPALSFELDLHSAEVSISSLSQGTRVQVTGTVHNDVLLVSSILIVPVGSTPITLYYYNPTLDQGPGGVQCSEKGLVAVSRVIPKTSTPLKDSIQLLLNGELSSEERARGITTEFPLPGVILKSAIISNGIATLTFDDPQNKTNGGSCRVAILWHQIAATAKQFSTVQSVRFLPEELFQP
jgi:hypothetical protein